MKWYQQSVNSVTNAFHSNNKTGLSADEVVKRLNQYGFNELPEVARETWITIFLSQFKNPLIYILLIAATIIYFVGEDPLDAFIISGIIFFNAIIGTIQEGRTHSIIQTLKRFIKTEAVVIRDGKKSVVQERDLVPGDLIIVQEGQRIPADARIIESYGMRVDEALLTGESVAQQKTPQPVVQEAALGDQTNMIFKGTYILAGSAKAMVIATGISTEVGKIQQAVEEIKTDIPLKVELNRLSYVILLFILGICGFLFILGLLTGKPLTELLVMLTALFICVVPEGLPVVLTLVLVTGVYRMAKRFVLVKNLQAVEALGRTDVIVIDKTGTLTRNEMIVTKVFADNIEWDVTGQGYFPEGTIMRDGKEAVIDLQSDIMRIGIAAYVLNATQISFDKQSGIFNIKGDPTEAALYILSKKLIIDSGAVEKEYKKIYEIPFDSSWQYHAGFFNINNEYRVFVIGSPEAIMKRSNAMSDRAQQIFNQFLDEGLRIIAVGTKIISEQDIPGTNDEEMRLEAFKHIIERDLIFLGFCGIQDSIRAEIADTIDKVRKVGIHLIMATGDHIKTALYVAKKVGIYKEGDRALTGTEFAQLSDDQLYKDLERITVYSRVSPQDKIRIVGLFHKKKNIVAMTGDGINDVPALVAADLGIAMGGIGTQVAKQAADIVLLDDSLINIIDAIKQGRHIFYTLRRVILYFFATNMGEVFIVLFALIAALPLPITAAQILWLNLVTDGFLDIALSMEPQESDMLENGAKPTVQLINTDLFIKSMFLAIPMGLGALIVFWYYYATDLAYARTMALITMAMFQWFNAWNCRSEYKSLMQLNFFTNVWLIIATALVFCLQVAILYVPILQKIFKTQPILLSEWLIIMAISSSIIFFEEIRKAVMRSGKEAKI